jgi:hypothetical protein
MEGEINGSMYWNEIRLHSSDVQHTEVYITGFMKFSLSIARKKYIFSKGYVTELDVLTISYLAVCAHNSFKNIHKRFRLNKSQKLTYASVLIYSFKKLLLSPLIIAFFQTLFDT